MTVSESSQEEEREHFLPAVRPGLPLPVISLNILYQEFLFILSKLNSAPVFIIQALRRADFKLIVGVDASELHIEAVKRLFNEF